MHPKTPASHVTAKFAAAFVGFCLNAPLDAQQLPAPDKSAYTLFNPTPRELMRELSPDRPDTTESPYTVDAGHLQIESSLVDYTRDRRSSGHDHTDTWSFASINLKLGLTQSTDLQFVWDPYTRQTTRGAAGSREVDEGVSDLTVRLKQNLWGNDAGDTAFALMPYLQLPTGDDSLSTSHLQGGLIFPLAIALNDRLTFTLMGEADFVYDESDRGYDLEFLHTASLGCELVGPLAGYVEYLGVVSSDAGTDYRASIGGGFTYALSDDLLLDCGANFGLTRPADDLNFFTGFTLRY